MRGTELKTQANSVEHFKERCKTHKIKLTPQRLIIYEELMKNQEHPSTEMVYQRVKKIFPTISFDTVNRTLLTFAEMGVAGILEGSGNPKRFDGNTDEHHHFQCVRCKRVVDIYEAAYDHLTVPQALQEQFVIFKATVHIEGLCDECRHLPAHKLKNAAHREDTHAYEIVSQAGGNSNETSTN